MSQKKKIFGIKKKKRIRVLGTERLKIKFWEI